MGSCLSVQSKEIKTDVGKNGTPAKVEKEERRISVDIYIKVPAGVQVCAVVQ